MNNSKIQWTDSTVNFWQGCHKVVIKDEEGLPFPCECRYCYMYRDKSRYGQNPRKVIRSSDATFYKALKWKEGRKIFTCSWSDFFIREADPWRGDAWEVIRSSPQHTWQILTKRPERIKSCLPPDWGKSGYPNVQLGVSIGIQGAMRRLQDLVQIKKDSSVFKTFLSLEPLIGPLDFSVTDTLKDQFGMIDWVIIGGESGNLNGKYRFRPSELVWYEDIIKQCQEKGIPVFIKQLGTHLARKLGLKDRHGGDMNEFPPQLRLRDFPI